jgi:hypothetical protein
LAGDWVGFLKAMSNRQIANLRVGYSQSAPFDLQCSRFASHGATAFAALPMFLLWSIILPFMILPF